MPRSLKRFPRSFFLRVIVFLCSETHLLWLQTAHFWRTLPFSVRWLWHYYCKVRRMQLQLCDSICVLSFSGANDVVCCVTLITVTMTYQDMHARVQRLRVMISLVSSKRVIKWFMVYIAMQHYHPRILRHLPLFGAYVPL